MELLAAQEEARLAREEARQFRAELRASQAELAKVILRISVFPPRSFVPRFPRMVLPKQGAVTCFELARSTLPGFWIPLPHTAWLTYIGKTFRHKV